ncbi:hypothetical protein L6452_38053 [Arctium lappa]|uniref:Uncharacterized protein n=1 Tax=Arctium lappa TaxID=4217 RepID=A0ACB8Y5R7_ARCLA|nr:hypothetical protein L6452_38053 [Arctium lappa]
MVVSSPSAAVRKALIPGGTKEKKEKIPRLQNPNTIVHCLPQYIVHFAVCCLPHAAAISLLCLCHRQFQSFCSMNL